MYIPPPPDEPVSDTAFQTPHSYPPKGSPGTTSSAEIPQRRFRFLRKVLPKPKANKKEGKVDEKQEGTSNAKQGPISWEENWEQGEYPFVSLEGNRASCVICLVDFEEPKRRYPPTGQGDEEKVEEAVAGGSKRPADDALVSSKPRQEGELKLCDAGDGAQPLRLLACGHVFHVSPTIFLLCHDVCLTKKTIENLPGSLAHRRFWKVSGLSAAGGGSKPTKTIS